MDKYIDYTKPRNGWYKRKNYPHFDVPLKYKNAKFFAYNFGKDPQYAFFPMIQFVKEEKRFRTIKVLENGKIVKRINLNLSIPKKRTINYPAHKDGYIYAYFQYLGFTYDGLNVLLRSGTLSKYWRKMIKGARRKVKQLKKDGYQVAFFNAWNTDWEKDPMVPFIKTIIDSFPEGIGTILKEKSIGMLKSIKGCGNLIIECVGGPENTLDKLSQIVNPDDKIEQYEAKQKLINDFRNSFT